ncbi:MAG: sigma-70 family RNA polymerase sigma factor [Planctomycetota bacterium]|nr:sigma-70 family RNA polymerase sigma factor [Planctomycetota bacterium]
MPQSEQGRARERLPDASAEGAGGEPTAWLRDHLDAVYRYARRRLSAADADDVAQDCFAALYRARTAGRAPDEPGAYLLGVARRRVADVYRRRGQRPPIVALPEGWEGYAAVALPAEVLQDAELRATVAIALGLLRPTDAALLEARYRSGASVAQLADQLARTPKAIENALRRARAAFQARYLEVGGLDLRPGAEGGAP